MKVSDLELLTLNIKELASSVEKALEEFKYGVRSRDSATQSNPQTLLRVHFLSLQSHRMKHLSPGG